MTDTQKSVIRCAYLDLVGALEDPHLHDWDAHKQSIKELEQYFPDVVGCLIEENANV